MENNIKMQTFRFTFSENFNTELLKFSKVHQYDDRKVFKESWEEWIKDEEIQSLINIELKSLNEDGFRGDAMDKMFKSARYYFRKKSLASKEVTKRKQYTGFSKPLLENMDIHIQNELINNSYPQTFDMSSNTEDIDTEKRKLCVISPEEAYNRYCEENKDMISQEINLIKKQSMTALDAKELSKKFKKTYKNRFYIKTKSM